MKRSDYNAIVKEAVAAGSSQKDAEAYVTSGFKLPVDGKGNPVFDDGEKAAAKPARTSTPGGGKGRKAPAQKKRR